MSEAVAYLSFEAFVAAEQLGDSRHEYVGGQCFAMAGGTERHDLAAGLVYEALASEARAAGCRPFSGNRLLRTARAAYYPDVMVVCGPARDLHFETDAALIVEVRSPSTAGIDRREKGTAYRSLPSLRHYVIVDPDRRRIEVGTPHELGYRWEPYGPENVVVLPYGVIVVDAFYDALDRMATTPRPDG